MSCEEEGKQAIRAWENAEVLRSAHEAAGIDPTSLKVVDLERYSRPLPSTPYPLEYACHLLGDVRGKIAFDLGCGAGENTAILLMLGASVTALDISPDLIHLARRRLEINRIPADNVRFMVGSAYETTLDDDSVDVVFGIGILHHLDLELAQKEVYRILRTGGCAIFQEPVRDSWLLRFLRRLILYRAPDVSPFERPLRSEELKTFAAPFARVEGRSFCLPHVPLVSLLAPRFLEAAYRLDGRLLSNMPLLGRYASIRVIKLTKP